MPSPHFSIEVLKPQPGSEFGKETDCSKEGLAVPLSFLFQGQGRLKQIILREQKSRTQLLF